MFRTSFLSKSTSMSAITMRGTRSFKIQVQLDYHPSSQYAGMHLALKKNLYASRGLEVILIKPSKDGGDEPKAVADKQAQIDLSGEIDHVSIGTVEQNVLIPAICNNVQVKAFATIFQRTPLILLGLPGTKLDSVADLKNLKIGMHIDSTELMKTIVFHSEARSSTVQTVLRENKMDLLVAGTVNAIQAYDCTEVIELQARLGGRTPSLIPVETLASQSGVTLPLGYSQVIFTPSTVLRNETAKKALETFLEVSVLGWEEAEKDPVAAVQAVMESRKALGYPSEVRGVVDENSAEFQRLSLARCLPYVKGTNGSHSIDPTVWQKASSAMRSLGFISKTIPASQSLDTTVWSHTNNTANTAGKTGACDVIDGLSLARKIRADVTKRSAAFLARTGTSPTIAVISFGSNAASDEQRMACFSAPVESWWTKQQVCQDVGIAYENIILPTDATPEQLKSAIMELNNKSNVHAILLERGLKSNMSVEVASSVNYLSELICVDKDVDGERPKSLASDGIYSLMGNSAALPAESQDGVLPCTVAAVLELIDSYNYSNTMEGANVVVVGRSRKLGLPLTLALIKRNATVTVCHSLTPPDELVRLCKGADFLFVAAGVPHLVDKDMVKPGSVCINIGTTYNEKEGTILPDVNPNVTSVVRAMSPTPHGVGPLPVAMLCHNTLVLAEAKARAADGLKLPLNVPTGWVGSYDDVSNTPYLEKIFNCKDFSGAISLVNSIRGISETLDHHPTLSINSKRVCEQLEGCDVHVQVSTYSLKKITKKDIQLATEIDKLTK